ncbi:MAG: SAM-dependent methyltransferase [Kiritimatiellia bacterium]|jgi:SAM-dependent methyltransferase
MSERWKQYFKDKIGEEAMLRYAFEYWNFRHPVYVYLQRYLPAPGKIIDIGCGMGLSGIFLESLGYSYMGIDNEPDIIEQAKEVREYFHGSTQLEVADAFDLSGYRGYQGAISFGVIEHFEREQTVELLRQQGLASEFVLAEIPTRWSGDPITDERLYSMRGFAKMFDEAGLTPVKKFTLGVPNGSFYLRKLLPPAIYHPLADAVGYAPGIAILGKRTR